MEEKILIKNKPSSAKKVFMVMLIIGVVLSAIMIFISVKETTEYYDYIYKDYLEHKEKGDCKNLFDSWGEIDSSWGRGYDSSGKCYDCIDIESTRTKAGYVIAKLFTGDFIVFFPLVLFTLIGGLLYLRLRKKEKSNMKLMEV